MIEKAEEKVAKISTDPYQREAALERERRQIAAQLIKTAAWDEGLAEGREKGLAQGLVEGIAQGREKGLAEGLAEGRREGLRQLLALQLEQAFGPLPGSVRERMAGASEAELSRWGKRVLDAGRLDEVFAEESAP